MYDYSPNGLFLKHSSVSVKSESVSRVEPTEVLRGAVSLCFPFSVVSGLTWSVACSAMVFPPYSLSTRVHQQRAQTNLFTSVPMLTRSRTSSCVSLTTTVLHDHKQKENGSKRESPHIPGLVRRYPVWLEQNLPF